MIKNTAITLVVAAATIGSPYALTLAVMLVCTWIAVGAASIAVSEFVNSLI